MDGSPHSKEQWTMPPLNMPWTTTVPSSIFLDGEKAFTTELERGTPPRKSSKGNAPGYCGETVYKTHRANSCKLRKADSCKPFIAWVVKQVREHK